MVRVRGFFQDGRGSVGLEYGMIVALVSGLVIISVNNVGPRVLIKLAATGLISLAGVP